MNAAVNHPLSNGLLFARHAALLRPKTIGELRAQFQLDWWGCHGVGHWARVLENGLTLCSLLPEARVDVVVLFALFHDARRENEYDDPEHGERAAVLVGLYFEKGELGLDAPGLALLREACCGHDQGRVATEATIAVCWDADRLDLGRVGIVPSPRLLSTGAARDPALLGRCLAASRAGEFPRRWYWVGEDAPLPD